MNITPRKAALIAVTICVAAALTACDSKSDGAGKASGASSGSASSGAPNSSSAPSGGVQPASGGPGKAVKLQVSAAVRQALGDAYFAKMSDQYPKETRAKVSGPSHVFYGKIGDKYYAAGDVGFSDNPMAGQDGPHVWDRGATDWEYEGDTGGALCGKVPEQLVNVWGKSCG